MADRSIVVRLRAETQQYIAGLQKAKGATVDFGREISGRGKTARADIEQIGRGALVMAGGLAVGLGLSAKAAMDWESSWAGVTKTVDGTATEMAALEQGLRDLAGELPATHGEIAAVAEAAGQLGIQRGAIEGFTRTMIDLGETTNLSADQAATAMARMSNIMRTPQADIDRMASTLVALGNAGASTESEILDMAQRIAGAGQQVGASEADVLGFANALSSVGIEAEAGGTAISRVFSTIASAVADGGDTVAGFADVAGMSVEEFSRAFEEDAAGATVAFIEGLDRISASGGNVFATLEQLELGDIRVRDALLRAAGAGDLFRESLALGAEEWERNLALQTEAEKRYDTTAAKLEIARNNVVDLGIDIGDVLLPALAGAAEGAGSVARGLGELPGPAQVAATGVAGVSTALLGTVGLVGTFGPKIKQAHDALMGMGAGGKFVARNMGRMAAGLGIAGIAIGGISYILGRNAEKAAEAEDRIKAYADAITQAGDTTPGLEDAIRGIVDATPDLMAMLDEAGQTVSDVAREVGGSSSDWETYVDSVLRASGALDETGIKDLARTRSTVEALERVRSEAQAGAEHAERLGRVTDAAGDEARTAAPDFDTMSTALGLNAEEAKEARKEFEELINAYRSHVDPLFGMLNALESNREAMGAEAELRAEGLRGITEAGEDLADAEKDLADARKVPDNVQGIAAAEERVADARERLTEAEQDAIITAEELAVMNRNVAETALDVEASARELAGGIRDGTVDIEQAKAMLREWQEQGIITAEQAKNVGEQFLLAAGLADAFAGDYVAGVYLQGGEQVVTQLREINGLLDKLPAALGIAPAAGGQQFTGTDPFDQLVASLGIPQRAAGGPVWPGQTFLVGEQGPELVQFPSPGRVFPSGDSMRGSWAPVMADGMGGSYDQSRHVTFRVEPTIFTPDPRAAAADVGHEARVLMHMAGG